MRLEHTTEMIIRAPSSIKLRVIGANMVGILIVGYLIFHLFSGERSLGAYFTLQREVRILTAMFEEQTEKEKALTNKVRLLQPESMDYDMLDEMIRKQLGFVREGDVVHLLNNRVSMMQDNTQDDTQDDTQSSKMDNSAETKKTLNIKANN